MSGWYPARFGQRSCGHFFADSAARSLCGKSARPGSDPLADGVGRRCYECRRRLNAALADGPQPGRDMLGRFVARHRTRPRRPHAVRRTDGQYAERSAVPLVFKLPVQPRVGKCPHGFTVTTRRNGAFACALCEEAAA